MRNPAALFIVLFLQLTLTINCFAKDTVTITTGEWIPYSSEHIKHNGVICRITTEAFALAGIKVKWNFVPWKRAYEEARAGIVDGSIFWYYNEERAKYFYFSDQIGTQSNVFFHLKKNKFNWKTITDLKGKIIGITAGYSYGKEFDEVNKKGHLTTQEVSSDELNFKKLLIGRIELFPMQMDIGYDLLYRKFTQKQIDQLTYHPKNLNNDPVYLILTNQNKKNIQRIKLFNKGLKKLKKSGKYDQYLDEVAKGYYSNN